MVYKYQQTIVLNSYSDSMSFYLDSHVPVDRIRVSIGGLIETTDDEGVLFWSDLTNTIIGSLGLENNRFQLDPGPPISYGLISVLKPEQGIDIFYENKIRVHGNYQLVPVKLGGGTPTAINANSDIVINIEYWAY